MVRAAQPWDPWPRRLLLRALGLVVQLDEADMGADFALDNPAEHAYDPDSSASAPLVFPWPYACARARSSAISRLPLRVYRWEDDDGTPRRAYLGDHWLTGLSERPNSYTPGITFSQELQQDLDNDGNCYVVLIGIDVNATPAQIQAAIKAGRLSLERVPPKRMKVKTKRSGIDCYVFDDGHGTRKEYDARLVLHVRRGSFRDGVSERFYGTGAVRPLTDLLNVEQSQAKRDNESASKGRPAVVISPAKENVTWSQPQRAQVKNAYEQMANANGGGAMVLSGHAKLDPISWTPEQMASQVIRDSNRSATLAAYRVPPVMVGLETANYATAREQKAVFWESIADDAALHAWMWTEIARRAGERDIYAELDISGVHELTGWKTEAINRANLEWLMGMDAVEAFRVNGLHEEAEVLAKQAAARKPKPKPAETTEDEEPRKLRVVQWWPQQRNDPEDDEETRAARWRAIDAQLLSLGEREMGLAMRRFLRDQADRVSEALEENAPRSYGEGLARDMVDAWIDAAFDAVTEGKRLDAATRQEIRAILMRAFDQGQADIGEDGVMYLSDRIDQMVDQVLAELVTNVNGATKSAINEIVRTGLAEGQTIADMQLRIMQSQAFSPARALTVARTETTRSTGAGTVQAYQQAAPQLAEQGIIVRKEWLSSRDSAVRDDHRALDKQVVNVDQPFTVPPGHAHTGAKGNSPGAFSEAGMSINCRCTVIPVIERTG